MTRNTKTSPLRIAVTGTCAVLLSLAVTACNDDADKSAKSSEATSTAATSTSSSTSTPATPTEGKAVANVDGQPILESDLELAETEIGGNLGTLPAATKRRVLVEYLVENQLFANAAKKEKLASGPEYEKLIAYWKQRALREAYFHKRVKSQIGEGMAKALYDSKVKTLQPEEEVEARHILVAKEEDAKKISEELKGGADFAELAKQHSGDQGSKENGGLLGYFGKGRMVPQFEQAAFALKPGEISEPVQSQFGWHIIKVENRRQKPPPSFEEVKPQIMGTLIHQRAQKVAEELRGVAKIEYLDPEIKAMVEADEKRKAASQSALEKQMRAQIEKMQAEQNAKADGETGAKTDASAAEAERGSPGDDEK